MQNESERLRKQRERKRAVNQTPPKSKKENTLFKQFLGVIAFCILALGGGVLGAIVVNSDAMTNGEVSAISQLTSIFAKEPEPQVIELEPFVTNLKAGSESNRQSLIKASLSFQVMGEENALKVEGREPKLRDKIIGVLSRETRESIYSEDHAGGLAIKGKIQQILNDELGDEIIKDVFITDIITQ